MFRTNEAMLKMGLLTLVIVAGVALISCTPEQESPRDVDPSLGAPAPDVAAERIGELREFAVEAYQFGFEPETIRVKKGDRVRITFTSRDAGHGVYLPDFGVSTPEFNKGESRSIEFTADQVGTFTYFCSVYCGQGHNEMTGKIIVEE